MDNVRDDTNVDVEDILNDALGIINEERISDDGRVRYGDLVLRVAPKEGKALTLLADQLFSPSLILAERIECGLIDLSGRSVLELGAGCAVPSLLAATLPPSDAPSLAVITDYPDHNIISNLRRNVDANRVYATEGCNVIVEGYEWGDLEGAKKLRSHLSSISSGFDTLVLSDLLHFDTSHKLLLDSVFALLARPQTLAPDHDKYPKVPQLHVAAGRYTPPSICADFLRLGEDGGLKWTEVPLHEPDAENRYVWRGSKVVAHPLEHVLSAEELTMRKEMCRYWIGEWA